MISLVLSALLALTAVTQNVSDDELQRFVGETVVPFECGDARLAGNAVRAGQSNDASSMMRAYRAYLACADSPYGEGSFAVRNASLFAASAAALYAARHEPNQRVARRDARLALRATGPIIDYRQTPGSRGLPRAPDPSPYVTDAGRIQRDAQALLSP